MQAFIEVELPFCLYLKQGWYDVFLLEDIAGPFQVYLEKFHRPKEKIDYTTFWRAERLGKGELWRDKNGIFRRSKAVVILPHSVIQPRDIAEHDPLFDPEEVENIISYSVKALNRLIQVYRYVTQDGYIPSLHEEDITNVFHVGLCTLENRQGHRRQLMGGDTRLVNTLPDYNDAVHDGIGRLLQTRSPVPLYEELILSARNLLEEGNARISVMEIQAAFEVFARVTVSQYYNLPERAGKIKNVEDLTTKDTVSVHLEKAIGKPFHTGQAEYDRWFFATYQLRNSIIHGGYTPNLDEANQALLAVESALEYLTARPKTKSWPKAHPSVWVNEFLTPYSEDSRSNEPPIDP